MIVAEPKPLAEVADLIGEARKILVVGCGGCVTVCLAGGEKETGILAASLRMLRKKEGKSLETVEVTLTRQCDPEYVQLLDKYVTEDVECIVSLACGVGVQFLAERFNKWVVPALNTKFAGGAVEHGVWEERCGLCGECILHKTGGICPIIRCSKSLLNGPCGGSQGGKCEVNPDIPCAWQLIYERLSALGKLDLLLEIQPPKDWSKARDGGPRKVVREDVRM
ncbi:MAG: methylenetetrahydrofolate reductase C-terminal domain-containing protein [Thermoanaerobacteraceae bacterium]|uniref:methylenetetrahydrofolate reductase C-terminal domain-containing protein n=1 Tax=Thermanaeromonas sp. C210 TaxID=2731925 RepID=UPI00155B4336|nr:methylenetetrahydrofolate reductase C-terminal domain-containing protein [Thermanaeromonas sp. C210]MBE3582192.1 methylenetetrahydrofolate reductase C-terminal domain-containing protein [Thermoanaerobacteraceae bacterium]GFN23610.1 zinc-finger protein [Thermanaeromonas sp. C210]